MTTVKVARKTEEKVVPAATVLAPVKLQRRPALIIGSAAALLLSALAAVWLWTSVTSSVEVVVARSTVPRGALITASDLTLARVSLDPVVKAVPAGEATALVGQRAAREIAEGSLLTPADVTAALVPSKGTTVVGLSLGNGMLPSIPLQNGDVVRVVQTPGAQGQLDDAAPVTLPATVVGVSRSSDGQTALVDLLVSADAAPDLAARAATGKVAVVLDSRDR